MMTGQICSVSRVIPATTRDISDATRDICAKVSHTEAGPADEGEDEGGDPGQHHVGAAAEHAQHVKHLV